jgi:hypothetical protein
VDSQGLQRRSLSRESRDGAAMAVAFLDTDTLSYCFMHADRVTVLNSLAVSSSWCNAARRVLSCAEWQLKQACDEDPPPERDELRFGGDYALFRKTYKAWNKRDATRRKKAAHLAARTAVPAVATAVQTPDPTQRGSLKRPRAVEFADEISFEDAMAQYGIQRDERRRLAKADAERERRVAIRESCDANLFADREADRKRAARRLSKAVAAASSKGTSNSVAEKAANSKRRSAAARAVRERRYNQEDLIFSIEEELPKVRSLRSNCWAAATWADENVFRAVLQWAKAHEPDGSNAWEDGVIAVAMDAARTRVGIHQQRVGAQETLEKVFAAQNEGSLRFTRWPEGARAPDPCFFVAWRALQGYCVCGCKPTGKVWLPEDEQRAVPYCLVHTKEAW